MSTGPEMIMFNISKNYSMYFLDMQVSLEPTPVSQEVKATIVAIFILLPLVPKCMGPKCMGPFFLFEVYPTCVSSKRCVFIISRANSYVGGRRKNCKLSKEEKKKRHLRRPPRGLLLLNKESHSGFYQSESKTAMF